MSQAQLNNAHLENMDLTLPDSAGVVFGSCDDRVSLVIEGATEYLIRVALEHLQTVPRLSFPNARSLIRRGCQNSRALGVEGDLGNLPLVASQNSVAGASHCVVHSGIAIRRGGD